jgi:hypothetical protein
LVILSDQIRYLPDYDALAAALSGIGHLQDIYTFGQGCEIEGMMIFKWLLKDNYYSNRYSMIPACKPASNPIASQVQKGLRKVLPMN